MPRSRKKEQHLDIYVAQVSVAEGGYCIKDIVRDGEVLKEPALCPVKSTEQAGFTLKPTKVSPALFKEFAGISNPEEAVKFANQHGFISCGEQAIDVIQRDGRHKLEGIYWFEPLELWQSEVGHMRRAIFLWEALQNQDEALLQKAIHWLSPKEDGQSELYCLLADKNDLIRYDLERVNYIDTAKWIGAIIDRWQKEDMFLMQYQLTEPDSEAGGGVALRGVLDLSDARAESALFVSGSCKHAEIWRLNPAYKGEVPFKKEDVFGPAKYILETKINQALKKYPVVPYLALGAPQEPTLRYRATNLLAAMWYQLLQAYVGKKEFVQCQICARWEDRAGRNTNWKAHSDCDNARRQARIRERQRTVKSMFYEGRSFQEIVMAVPGSEAATVRGWLEKLKKSEAL